MLTAFMRSSYRGVVLVLACGLSAVASACAGHGSPAGTGGPGSTDADSEFVGFITDTECGPNHAPMIAKGGMGKDDGECTRICVKKGATYGFVDVKGGGNEKGFYQLDDQDAPAPFAGRRVRIRGRRQGDSILVRSIAPAD
jgi:hypothetical protein